MRLTITNTAINPKTIDFLTKLYLLTNLNTALTDTLVVTELNHPLYAYFSVTDCSLGFKRGKL